MADLDVTARLGIDVTNFKKGIREASLQIKEINAAFKESTAGLGRWQNSQAGVEAKIKQLSSTLVVLKDKSALYRKELEEANKAENVSADYIRDLEVKLHNCESQIKNTEKQLGDYNRKLEDMNSETGKLSKTISDQEKALEELKKEYKNYAIAGQEDTNEAKALAKAIEDLSTELAANKKKMAEAGTAAEEFDHSLDGISDDLQDVDKYARDTGDGFTVMKGALADLISAGIKNALSELKELGKEMLDIGTSYEAAMDKVQGLSSASDSEMKKLSKEARDQAKATKYTATDTADALGYMALAGWDATKMTEGLPHVLNLATGANMDLAKSSDIVTDNITAFKLEAKDTAKFTDQMAFASAKSNTTVEQLGEAYKNTAATAASLGYSVEDTTATLMVMANAGVKGGEAGTALSAIMTRLATDTKGCATELKEYGVEIYDERGNMKDLGSILEGTRKVWGKLTQEQQANLAKSIAGTSHYSQFAVIMEGLASNGKDAASEFRGYADSLKTCDGFAKKLADTMEDNLQGDLDKLKSGSQELMLQVMDKLGPKIRDLIKKITKELPEIGKGVEKVGGVVTTTAGFIVDNFEEIVDAIEIIGPAIATAFIGDKILSFAGFVQKTIAPMLGLATATEAQAVAQETANAAMLANPYVLLAAGIAAAGAALAIYYKHAQEAIEAEFGLSEGAKEVIDRTKELKESFEDSISATNDQIKASDIQASHLSNLWEELKKLHDKNEELSEEEKKRADFIINTLSKALGVEREEIEKIVQGNEDQRKSIEELIKTKQIEAKMSAATEIYNKAYAEQTEIYENLTEAAIEKRKAEEKLQEVYEGNKYAIDMVNRAEENGLGVSYQTMEAFKGQIMAYNEARGAVEKTTQAYNDAKSVYEEHIGVLHAYETATAEVANNNIAAVENELKQIRTGHFNIKADYEEFYDEEIQAAQDHYNDLEELVLQGNSNINLDELDAAAEKLVNLKKAKADELNTHKKANAEKVKNQQTAATTELNNLKTHNREILGIEDQKNADMVAKSKAGGEQTAQSFSYGLGFKIGLIEEKMADIVRTVAKKESEAMEQSYPKGQGIASNLASGIQRFSYLTNNAAGSMASGVLRQLGVSDKASTLGGYFAQGFANGILNGAWRAVNAAASLAAQAINAVRKKQDSNSPSKVTQGLGGDFGDGYVLGIDGTIKDAIASARNLTKGAIDALNVDLPSIGTPAVAGAGGVGGSSVVNNYNFTQNNTSPQALDTLTIYRQTKNALKFAAK